MITITEIYTNNIIIRLGKALNMLINNEKLSLREKRLIDEKIFKAERIIGGKILAELVNAIIIVYSNKYNNSIITEDELRELMGQANDSTVANQMKIAILSYARCGW